VASEANGGELVITHCLISAARALTCFGIRQQGLAKWHPRWDAPRMSKPVQRTMDNVATTASTEQGRGAPASRDAGSFEVLVGSAEGRLSLWSLDPSDGSLRSIADTRLAGGLDFMCLGRDERTLFVSRAKSVAAYDCELGSGTLSLRSEASTQRKGTHVTVDPSGRYVFVAHYHDAALSFLTYSPDTGFGPVERFSPGDNAHQTRVDAAGRHVYVPCLGSDHIAEYDLDPEQGTLRPAPRPSAPAPGGPRHMDFHPSAPVAYVLTEKSSELHVFDIQPATGALVRRPLASVPTAADARYHWSSDVHLTPDGKYLLAANRQPSELVSFQVQSDYGLLRLGAEPLLGPVRAFALDPSGRHVQVGGEDGALLNYCIETADGRLRKTACRSDLGKIRAILVRKARLAA
jgi:6-phosphogluconolactonase